MSRANIALHLYISAVCADYAPPVADNHGSRLVHLSTAAANAHLLSQEQAFLDRNHLFDDRNNRDVTLLPRFGRRIHDAVDRHALHAHIVRKQRLVDIDGYRRRAARTARGRGLGRGAGRLDRRGLRRHALSRRRRRSRRWGRCLLDRLSTHAIVVKKERTVRLNAQRAGRHAEFGTVVQMNAAVSPVEKP
jgi:hypothetical protein